MNIEKGPSSTNESNEKKRVAKFLEDGRFLLVEDGIAEIYTRGGADPSCIAGSVVVDPETLEPIVNGENISVGGGVYDKKFLPPEIADWAKEK